MAAGARPRSKARAKNCRAIATFPSARWRSPSPARRSAWARAAGPLDDAEGAAGSLAVGLVWTAIAASAGAANGAGAGSITAAGTPLTAVSLLEATASMLAAIASLPATAGLLLVATALTMGVAGSLLAAVAPFDATAAGASA